jgi:uncharacterized protein YlxP (DUF503 family)
MYVAALTLDVLLGDVRSLKQKRAVVKPLVAELRRRYPGAAVAETGHLDLHRRAEIGVAVVSDTAGNASQVLDECERLVASRPEIELLSARQRLYNEEELSAAPRPREIPLQRRGVTDDGRRSHEAPRGTDRQDRR